MPEGDAEVEDMRRRQPARARWVCEWCEPSDIPMLQPTHCAILYCPKHGMKTWHYPREEQSNATPSHPIASEKVAKGI